MVFRQVTNSFDLTLILKKLYANYRPNIKFDIHVVPIDKLKDIKRTKYQIIIVNFDKSTGVGSHWVLVLMYDPEYAIYFDSYGLDPPKPILEFMRGYLNDGFTKKMVMNSREIQNIKQEWCGWACMKLVQLVVNKNMKVYDALERINGKNIVSYGRSLTKKYLQPIK